MASEWEPFLFLPERDCLKFVSFFDRDPILVHWVMGISGFCQSGNSPASKTGIKHLKTKQLYALS